MEHRCGHRRPTTLTVTVRTVDGIVAAASLRDISASGAFIASHWPVTPHRRVYIQIRSAESSDSAVAAEVVRSDADGFAVEWQAFSPSSIRKLMRQLAHDGVGAETRVSAATTNVSLEK